MSFDPSDNALRHRLHRLLDAVPVEAITPAPLPTPGPIARSRVSSRLSLGLTGVTIAIAAIFVAALASGQRPSTGAGPVTAVATDGPFRVTITVPRATYAPGEPITGITASLEYTGQDGPVAITHAAGGPLAFSVASLDGRHRTVPVSDLACATSELTAGQPTTQAFGKSGGYAPEDSDYPWLASFFSTQGLTLDAGRWTISAIAQFGEGTCGGTSHTIRASATIEVSSGTALLPSPTPTAIAGLATLTVSQAIRERDAGRLGRDSFVLAGYWSSVNVVLSCTPQPTGSGVLEMGCYGGLSGITERPEPIITMDQLGYVTPASGPFLNPWIAPDVAERQGLFSLPVINGQWYRPVPIEVVGHFSDERAAQCRPEVRQACLDRLVVERIVSFDPGSVPTPGVSPTPTPFPSPAPPGLFGAGQCSGDIPYSFIGWTTTQELHIPFDRPGHVWAMVTRDVVKLTEGGWQDDPSRSGHQFQIWGQRVCIAQEDPHNPGPATAMEFAAVDGTTYVLWDDGLRTPGMDPVRPTGS